MEIFVSSPQYTVQYDACGGSGAPASQLKEYGKTLTLSGQKPTRSGYTFAGWATTPGGNVAYNAGGSYTRDESVTLYAVWKQEAVTYPQYFNCNVQIDTVKGKTVNLYYNLYDSRRADYFDKGQTAYAQTGARLEDGSVWYRIKAISSVDGKVYDYWLKYESGKMSVR